MVKKGLVVLLLVMSLISLKIYADEILNVKIAQVEHNNPEIKIYFNLFDENDEVYDAALNTEDVSIRWQGETRNDGILSRNQDVAKNCIFLVDISKSLTAADMEDIHEFMNTWISNMSDIDSAGIVTFGDEIVVLNALTNSKDDLYSSVDLLERTDNSTAFFDGIDKGLQLIKQNENNLDGRNMIIVFSDGLDEDVGAITMGEVQEEVAFSNTSIYGIGTASSLNGDTDNYLDDFAYLTRLSGGSFYKNSDDELSDIYSKITDQLDSEWCYAFMLDSNMIDYEQKSVDIIVNYTDTILSDSKVYIDNTYNIDDIMPDIVNWKLSEESDYITITFSEPMKNLDDASDIGITLLDGTIVNIYYIEQISDIEYGISTDTINSDIYMEFIDLVDNSMEENQMEKTTYLMTFEGVGAVNTDVEEEVSSDSDVIPPAEPEDTKKIQWYIWLIVGLGIIMLGVIALLIIKKSHKKKGLIVAIEYENLYMKRPATFKCDLLKTSIQVGRSERCNLLINDAEVSKEHFQIFYNEGYIFLKDLGSRNGITCNDKKVTEPVILNGNDIIKAGKTVFKFLII